MSQQILYALFVVYIIICIAIFAFLASGMVSGDRSGLRVAMMAIPFIPLWPLALPVYAYVRYQDGVRDTTVEAEKQRLFREESARAYDASERERLNAEMHARMTAEAKAKEQADAAAREQVVAVATEAKTAATTVPVEPAAVVTTEATPAK